MEGIKSYQEELFSIKSLRISAGFHSLMQRKKNMSDGAGFKKSQFKCIWFIDAFSFRDYVSLSF